MRRRDFLEKGGLTLAGAPLIGCRPPLDDCPDNMCDRPGTGGPLSNQPDHPWQGDPLGHSEAFPYGVSCGDPTEESLILWTYFPDLGALRLEFSFWQTDEWVDQPPLSVQTNERGFVHWALQVKQGSTHIAYRFVDPAERVSSIGYGKTCPSPDHQDLAVSLLAVSCVHPTQNEGRVDALSAGANDGPHDLMIWVGDSVYVRGRDQAAFSEAWRVNMSKPAFQEALLHSPHAFIWDDHEVANNWDPETINPQIPEWARRAFFDHTPTRVNLDYPERLWRSLKYGKTVEIFFLDCRSERKRSSNRYLSEAQWQWLTDGLNTSDATWKLIINSVPLSILPFEIEAVTNDTWAGWPAERERIIALLSRTPGAIILSGDYHMPLIGRVDPEGPGNNLIEILTGPVGSSPLLLGPSLPAIQPSQFIWGDMVHTATTLEFGINNKCTVRFINEDGDELVRTVFSTNGELISLFTSS